MGRPPANFDDGNLKLRFWFHPKWKPRFFLDNFFRFLLPCLIPIIFGFFSIMFTQRYFGEELNASNERVLNQYNEFLHLIVEEVDSLSLFFDADPVLANTFRGVMTTDNFSLEDLKTLRYLENVIAIPADSRPYIYSIYVYYTNPYQRFYSSRENISYLDTFYDPEWLSLYRGLHGENNDGGNGLLTVKRAIRGFGTDRATREVVSIYKPIANQRGLLVVNVRPEYFEESFDAMRKLRDQAILVLDDRGRLLMSSGRTDMLSREEMEQLIQGTGQAEPVTFRQGKMLVTMKNIPRLNWSLVTITPEGSIYRPLRTLTQLAVTLSIGAILISALLAFMLTRRHYQHVSGIIRTLQSVDAEPAAGGAKSVRASGKIKDVYELITYNILESFLQQKYLKVQLSEQKYREQALELKALQTQINPHFLYNTLHSIYWKSIELTRSPNDVSQMIEHLSDLLEYALRVSDELVSLEEEVINTRSYIHIQEKRYPGRLRVHWGSMEGLEACKVLKLSLQPIIENSIHYGLDAREVLDVKVKFRLDDRGLTVTVTDNGPGMTKERLGQIAAQLCADEERSDHLGLYSIYKRLGLKYGTRSAISIRSKPGWGTSVSLLFPQEK